MLRQKHFPEGVIQEAMNEIDEEEYLDILQEELQKKIRSVGNPGTPATKRKLVQFAQQRGFEYEYIVRALERITAK